jgi:PTS system cellobiose-specific IIC component
MKNLLEKVENAAGRSVILRVLRGAMLPVLPLVIIGSIFQIIASLPTLLPFLPAFSDRVSAAITLPYTVLNGIIGLIVAFSVGYYYAKEQKINQLYGGVLSVGAFLVACNHIYDGAAVEPGYLGSGGMFTAIVVAFVTVGIMGFCKKKNITIKLPDAVPPAVASSFDTIISGALAITVIHVINLICVNATGSPLPDIFLTILSPLFKASNSVWFLAFVLGFINLCWFFGIHGFNMLSGILMPLLLGNLSANAEALAAGGVGTNIGTLSFFFMAGHYLFLVPVVVLAVAKSEQLKAVGKLSLIPALFNISEPYQFGLPIAGNVDLLIPNVLYLVVNTFIYYYATKFGLLGMTYVLPSTVLPHPIFDYIATNGDFRSIIIWAITFAIDFAIWAPFVKAYDKKLLAEEQARVAEKTE